jgi:RNA polymerase sigma factor (sigma-70 family)
MNKEYQINLGQPSEVLSSKNEALLFLEKHKAQIEKYIEKKISPYGSDLMNDRSDVFQMVMLAFLTANDERINAFNNLDYDAKLKYVLGTAKHKCIDQIRSFLTTNQKFDSISDIDSESFVDSSPSVYESVHLQDIVEEFSKTLNPNEKEFFELLINDHPKSVIIEKLDITESNYRKKLQRLREKLKPKFL